MEKVIIALLQEPSMLVFLISLIIFLLMLANVIYFHFRYQKSMEKELLGNDYHSGGFLYDSTRLMMYGHYILFPRRAKKANVYTFFKNIPSKLKAHLLIHWFGLVLSSLLFFGSILWLYFTGEI